MITKTKVEIEKMLETNDDIGLTSAQVKERLEKNGFNELTEKKKESLFIKFLLQFKETLTIILLIAAYKV